MPDYLTEVTDAARDVGISNRNVQRANLNFRRMNDLLEKHGKTLATVTPVVANNTPPSNPSGVSGINGGKVVDNVLLDTVTVQYTAPSPLGSFAGVFLVAKNYNGSATLVKIGEDTFHGAAGTSQSFITVLQRTGETVTFYVVPKTATEFTSADWTTAPSFSLTLNGQVTAPPAPAFTQTLTATPTGYQFSFNQVVVAGAVIDSYKVYRNTVNTTSGASVIRTFKHDQTNAGASIVVQDVSPDGVVYYYWVSTINTSGLESTLAPAQSGTVFATIPLTMKGAPVVNAPLTPTNSLTNGGGLAQWTAGLNVGLPGVVDFDVQTTGGIIEVLLYSSTGGIGPNGYLLRFDARIAHTAGQILKITNGTWANIGTAIAANNASTLSGWHSVTVRITGAGQFDIFVDGIWQTTAVDTAFSLTGATYYGYEVLPNSILAPPAFLGKTQDHLPDGSTYARPLATRVSSGKPLIDFSESIHLNKNVDNIADGGTYARSLASRINAGRPWIDFSEAIHLNKTVDNVGDGTTYGRTPQLGGNLLPDSGYELGTTYWTTPTGFAVVQGGGANGTNAIRVQWNAGFMSSAFIPVTAGTSYVLSAYFDQTNVTCPAGQRSFITQINFYDSSNTVLQQSFVNWSPTNDAIGSAFATGLTLNKYSTYVARIGMTCTAPTGAVKAKILTPQGGTANTAGTQLYSAPQFEVGTVPSPYRQRIGDGITGYLLPGAAAIDLASGIHVNKILDNVGDGTTFKRLANVNADNTLHISTPIIKQGSIAAAGANNFSYTSTTTSITWSWGAFSVYGPDGTTYNFSSGSATAFTGLTASTTYHFGLYVTLATLMVHVALSTQTSGKAKETQSVIVQTFNADGNVAINVDATAATPASGSGGGGGGGASCFSGNTKVKTDRGNVRFDALKPGDLVLTARGTWKPVLAIIHRSYKGMAIAMGNCEFVTPTHLLLAANHWTPSADHERLTECQRVVFDGDVWNALVDADDDWMQPDTEHSYTLANGIVAHNPIT